MNSIDNISARVKVQQKVIPAVQNSDNMKKTDNQYSNKDAFSMSPEWDKNVDWGKAVHDELETLMKSFPDVNIVIAEACTNEELTKIAEELGYGTHLIVSKKWLEQMKSGAESYERGKDILKRLLSCLSKESEGAASIGAYVDEKNIMFWSGKEKEGETTEGENEEKLPAFDSYKSFFSKYFEKKETTDSFADKYRTKAKSATHSVSGLYARLAGAGSKSGVQSAMSEARQNIGSLRLASSFGTAEERQKARASITSLEKLLLRGNRKIRRLTEDDLVRLREKRARKQDEDRKALQLRIEMQKRQKQMQSANRAIALEGHLDDVNQAARFHKSKYGDYEYSQYAPAPVPVMPQMPSPAISPSDAGGSSSAPLEITLAPVVET